MLAELGLPDISPIGGRVNEAVSDALRQAQISHVTRAVWFYDRKLDKVPAAIESTSGVKAVQIAATKPVIAAALHRLAETDGELVVIAYLGGYLVTTDDED